MIQTFFLSGLLCTKYLGTRARPGLPPLASSLKISQRFIQNNVNVDDVLSFDLKISFASNVSLNSPPHEQLSLPFDCEPMDISPAPPVNPPSRLKSQSKRPRAFMSGARLFGNDISNNTTLFPSPSIVAAPTHKAMGSTSAKRTQRAALPTEWLTAISVPEPPAHQVCVTQTTMECMLTYSFFFVSASQEPPSPLDDPMDVNTSYIVDLVPPPVSFPSVPHSAAPTITTFNQIY
jgi:M-phase inducer tyrosine phosphatase